MKWQIISLVYHEDLIISLCVDILTFDYCNNPNVWNFFIKNISVNELLFLFSQTKRHFIKKFVEYRDLLYILAYNSCKCIDAFKIKYNFYYKNINNQSNYFFQKQHLTHTYVYICICIDTFKIKHNFYNKNINNQLIFF